MPDKEIQKVVTVKVDVTKDINSMTLDNQELQAQVDEIMEQIQPALNSGQLVLKNFEDDKSGRYCEEPEVQKVLNELRIARVIPTDIAKAARSKFNAAEKKRKDVKAPILEAGKKIDDLYRPQKEKCEVIKNAATKYIFDCDAKTDAIVRASNAQAAALQEKAAAESAARMAAERRLEPDKEPEPSIVKAPEIISTPQPTNTKTYWKADLIDEKAVPDTFSVDGQVHQLKIVDMVKVRQIVKNAGRDIGIPGVKCYSEKGFVTR